MTRDELWKRWEESDRELAELWGGKICDDPVKKEDALVESQGELDFEDGMEWVRKRDHVTED